MCLLQAGFVPKYGGFWMESSAAASFRGEVQILYLILGHQND